MYFSIVQQSDSESKNSVRKLILKLKGLVHFKKKLLLIIYSPMSYKMSTSFFLQSKRNEGSYSLSGIV